MITIVCHPNNYQFIKTKVIGPAKDTIPNVNIEIVTDEYVAEKERTGKFLLPNGCAVEEPDIYYRTPLITYGPEDKEYLLYTGIIKHHYKIVFYMLNNDFNKYMIPSKPEIPNKSFITSRPFIHIPKAIKYGHIF